MHHMVCNCQTKASPPRLSGAGFVDSVETLEDARKMFGGDAGTKVADAELDGFDWLRDLSRADDDSREGLVAGLTVFDSVFDKVAEHLEDGVGVGDDLGARDLADLEDGVGVLYETAHGLDGVAHQHVG